MTCSFTPSPPESAGAKGLRRSTSTILFADVVDSVRLIEADEETIIRRWIGFVEATEAELSEKGSGRIVKRMGDGLMLEFDAEIDAVRAALSMRDRLAVLNRDQPRESRIEIRIGLHMGEVLRSADSDLYGQHVNIAARLAAAAQPGAISASAEVRDALASSIDAEFEDMGQVFLKNVSTPVHAFRVASNSETPRIVPLLSADDLLPTIAVLPIRLRRRDGDAATWGDLLTEDLIIALSRSQRMNVISRLSTAGIDAKTMQLDQIGSTLQADFVLSGTCAANTKTLVLDIELAAVRSKSVIWSDRVEIEAAQLLEQNAIFSDLAGRVHSAILNVEMRRAQTFPVPTLEAYSLLMGSVALMHRLSTRDFALAGDLLDSLIERIPHTPSPLAWKSRWHVLKVVQGWSDDPMKEAHQALEHTRRALDLDPTNTSALIAEGFVRNNLLHDLDEAEELYDSALEHSPNDATGRALRGTLYAFRGEGARAVRDSERALHLAPLDPNRFFFQALAAGACVAAEDYPRALELAKSSLRLNRSHTSTLRVKAVTELRMGMQTQARLTIAKLMKLQPGFSISSWERNSSSTAYPVGRAFAASLRELGVPE